jgi:predicted enzyme related to lactoylglutathione lyase
MANTFDWVEIRTHNVRDTAHFFAQLFGWKVLERIAADGSPYWIFDTGQEPRVENLRRGALWLRPAKNAGLSTGAANEGPRTVVYILVENIDATLKRVVALGGKIVEPKVAEGRAFKAYFATPDGNIFGLWQEEK